MIAVGRRPLPEEQHHPDVGMGVVSVASIPTESVQHGRTWLIFELASPCALCAIHQLRELRQAQRNKPAALHVQKLVWFSLALTLSGGGVRGAAST